MDELNLTGSAEQAQSGRQESVVGSSQESSADTSAASQERAVAAQTYHNPDFDLVDTVGGDSGDESANGGNGAETDTPTETGTQSSETGGAGRSEASKGQSREENAAIRAARLRGQRDAEASAAARAAAQADAEIANMKGLINPYTKRPFSSMRELQDYSNRVTEAERARQARASGRSVEDLAEDDANRAFLSDLRRQVERDTAMAQAAQREANARRAFVENDVLDFMEKHPEMDIDGLSALENNPTFLQFCGTRFGREPLSDLYDAFQRLVGDAGRAAVSKATSRSARSTGGGTTGGATLSPEQKKALDRWNEENPEMRMTPQEFLRR